MSKYLWVTVLVVAAVLYGVSFGFRGKSLGTPYLVVKEYLSPDGTETYVRPQLLGDVVAIYLSGAAYVLAAIGVIGLLVTLVRKRPSASRRASSPTSPDQPAEGEQNK